MNKKKLLKIGVVVFSIILIVGILGWYTPFKGKDITISFSASSDVAEGDAYKVYYLTEKNVELEGFTEEQSVYKDVIAGETNRLSFTVPEDVEVIRLDVGTHVGDIIIDDMTVSCGNVVVQINYDLFLDNSDTSGITDIKKAGEGICIVSDSEDPYIIWEMDTFISEEARVQEVKNDNYLAKTCACIVVALLLIAFLKKYDVLVEFPVEIYQSRKLIGQLSINDFKTKYAGSYLGIVWAFVQPIITILVYWFVFGIGLRSGDVLNVPFVLWLVAGLVPWFFFSDAWNGGTGALIEYQYLVKKVVFQIDILPLVKVLSAIFVHGFFVLFTIVLYACYGYFPDLYILQIVYYTFCTFVLVLGLSYITSAIVGFFRDLSQIIGIVLQVGVWMTPIMWNMDGMNIPSWAAFLLKLNPMYYIVAGYRDALINKVWFWEKPTLTMCFWAVALFILGLGALIFKKLKVHFADVL